MELAVALILGATFACALVLTGMVRHLARSHGLIDVPNARSSHETPTPRGGGVAIIVAATGGLVVLVALHKIPLDLFLALAGGGIAVATVGFLDDRRGLPAWLRLSVHVVAAAWALAWLGIPALRVGDHVFTFGVAGYLLGVLGIVWTLNLFNFMDGIDGIAASEGLFVSGAGALLALAAGANAPFAAAAVLAAACLGFLRWNWPRARIFMGDVGSGYIGYALAVLALAATRENPVAMWTWLILGGAFFVDATVTLLRRLARREPVFRAHRSHAYQWLARRWGSHRAVTLLALGINVCWLLPLAFWTTVSPEKALPIVALALLPLAPLALLAGAGRREADRRGEL